MFGGNRVYLWDPGALEWRVYIVSKPIYYIVSGSRLGSYYVLFYGTYEDDDPNWEGYLTDLCGHDYYVYDVPSSNLPTYTGFSTKFVYITSNYIVVGAPFSGSRRLGLGIATYGYTTSVSSVSIYSSVDCSVCVNGELVGNITSGSWLNFTIEHGVHNISIIGSDSYAYIVSMLEVSEDLVIIDPLKPMLAVINGTVVIESLYTVISIYVNGSYVASISPGENYTLSLEPGTYNVTLVALGRETAVYIITLSENEAITIVDPF